MWNPFRPKPKEITVPNLKEIHHLIWPCPPQQLITRRCVCMNCEKRGVCYTERLISSDNNCENNWINACSLFQGNKEDSMFNALFAEYYEALKRRCE